MSEVGARILRPGAATSLGTRSQNKISFLPTGTYSALSNNIRQVYPSPRDSNQISEFKNSYQQMMTSLASFLSHNNTTTEFRAQFNVMINEMDNLFNTFIANMPRTASSATKSARVAKSQASDRFLQLIFPFLKQFGLFTKAMSKIRQSGDDPIHEAIDMHFTIINDCLETVRKSSTSATGMHDATVRRAKTLESHLMNLKRSALNVIQEAKDTTKITTEIRNFSRTLNHAFTNEFADSPLGPTPLEKLRSESYTSCCAIIHSVRDANMFDSHSTQMFESYDIFRNQLKILLEKNGVEKTLSELVDCDIEDVEQITFKFDKDAPLLQILFKAKEFFDDKKVQEFIDVVHEKSTQIIKESVALQKQISEFANLQNQIKQAKVERDAARKITEDTRKENEEMRQILNENMKKMEEYDKNSGADTQFKRAITESIDSMAKVLNEEVPEMDTDRGILMVYRNYLKAVFEQKCKNCALNMERNKRMTEMMYPIVEKDQDIEKMVSSLVTVTKECQNNLKSRSIEISQINIELISQRESFNKILSLINKKPPNGMEIGEYTYNAVKNNLDEIKRNIDGIVDQKSLAQQEFVADLMKRFKTILETDQTESIESYLFQIENRLRQAEQEHMNYNIFLNNMSLRLYTILKKEKKSNPSIEDEVNEAVSEVQNYISAIENTPKQTETVNVTDYSLIADKLSKILEKDVDKESEVAILQAIDDMNDYLNMTRKRFKTASAEASRCKGEMIDIVDKLQNFLNQPSNIPRDLEKIVELANDLIKKLLAQRNELKLADITKMFEPVFQYLHTSSQSDPFSFIPDFVNEFQMVESSVQSLKPFALILNNIFTNFDCQYSSFDPKSHSYNYLKGQVNELHQTLGSMSAAKTHNLIYLVLSRFVTFVSSISSAIAMAYEAKGK